MKEHIDILGFKVNIKKTLIAIIVYLAVVILLLGIHFTLFEVSWYGFIIGTGFLVAVILACELMPERGLPKDFPYDLIWWVFPFAIVGARIGYVVNDAALMQSFYSIIAVWEGGLSIYGGVMGGSIGLVIACLIKKHNIIKAMDVVAPVLILAQAIGRWGNFVNQEVYGWEITNKALQWFPFGVNINGTWHLATFFYESMLNLGGFFILLFLLRKFNIKGIVVSAYLAYYGIVRFFLEMLREQQFIMQIPGTSIQWSSLVSIIAVVLGIIGIIVSVMLHRKKQQG